MKRITAFLAGLLTVMTLVGCAPKNTSATEPDSIQEAELTAITAETTLPDILEETTVSAFPEEETAEPPAAGLALEGVDAETVITYFAEVCLNAEFVNSGDPSFLQKWAEPIYYTVYGTPTQEDLDTLHGFADWLNTVEGFPGIYETEDPVLENLSIHFCTQEEMVQLMGDQFYGNDGAVTFWYRNDEIYRAVICCRSDIDQYTRNSVILEEIYNGLGPIQDTVLRTDSIIWAEYSEPQQLTAVDELILKLLYHPRMKCGMNAEECADVIRVLYS